MRTEKHTDIFHCQKCGKLVYEEHGCQPPECCGEPMTRAVADIVSESDVVSPEDAETPKSESGDSASPSGSPRSHKPK